MGLIQVTTGELEAAAGSIERALSVSSELSGSQGSLAGMTWAAGSHGATAAITDFLAAWSRGVGWMVSDGDRLSGLLRSASAAYAQTDSAIEGAAR